MAIIMSTQRQLIFLATNNGMNETCGNSIILEHNQCHE